jgi:hypothetical protein
MRIRLLTIAACLTACISSEPPEDSPPDYRGEHFVVFTEYDICGGTLAKFDEEIERIDAALGLEGSPDISEVWVLGDDVFDYCLSGACVKFSSGRMYIHSASLDVFPHEAVHQRANPTGANLGKPLFTEGLATALGGSRCYDENRVFSSLDDHISPSSAYDLPEHSYYLGGELIHWLLDTRGPEIVLEFMKTLDRKATPDQVREVYSSFFDSSLDEDLMGHLRPINASYEPWELACAAPAAERDDRGSGFRFQETLDCESPRVQSDLTFLGGQGAPAFVEWSVVVDESNAGYFNLAGDLPTAGSLSLRPCGCIWGNVANTVGISPPGISAHNFNNGIDVLLPPGRYLATWNGQFDAVLDVQLSPPCTFDLTDCPSGQQCTIWNRCEPEATELAQPGDSCELADGLRSCVSGSLCVGGTCVLECDSDHPCPGADLCGPTRLCGPACDLLAQDCSVGSSCGFSSASDGTGQCLPSGPGQLLDPCHRLDDTCSSGLVCGSCGNGQTDGCCVPICESSAECPEEFATCGFAPDASVGVCV